MVSSLRVAVGAVVEGHDVSVTPAELAVDGFGLRVGRNMLVGHGRNRARWCWSDEVEPDHFLAYDHWTAEQLVSELGSGSPEHIPESWVGEADEPGPGGAVHRPVAVAPFPRVDAADQPPC